MQTYIIFGFSHHLGLLLSNTDLVSFSKGGFGVQQQDNHQNLQDFRYYEFLYCFGSQGAVLLCLRPQGFTASIGTAIIHEVKAATRFFHDFLNLIRMEIFSGGIFSFSDDLGSLL